MNNLYEALEICLQDLEKGADLESVLFRYPDLADELRPILEASAGVKSIAVPAPSAEVVRRNRSKVLQHAAQLRESNVRSSQRMWFASLRRIAVTLAVVALLFISGTSLVSASSNTLPGDNLYPVKRTWEGLRLFLTFNPLEREALELEHENERLYELKELFKEGRSEEVDFKGYVMSQNGNEWIVSDVRVLISNQTEMRDPGITVGDAVRVRGVTQGNDTILAERIRLLSDGGHEGDGDNENNSGSGNEGSGDEDSSEEDNSGPGGGTNSNENDNGDNSNEGNNSNDNDGSNHDNSGSSENSGSGTSGGNDNNNSDDGSDDSSNDNGNDSGRDDNQDNEDDSGGDGNSGPGGGDDD